MSFLVSISVDLPDGLPVVMIWSDVMVNSFEVYPSESKDTRTFSSPFILISPELRGILKLNTFARFISESFMEPIVSVSVSESSRFGDTTDISSSESFSGSELTSKLSVQLEISTFSFAVFFL